MEKINGQSILMIFRTEDEAMHSKYSHIEELAKANDITSISEVNKHTLRIKDKNKRSAVLKFISNETEKRFYSDFKYSIIEYYFYLDDPEVVLSDLTKKIIKRNKIDYIQPFEKKKDFIDDL